MHFFISQAGNKQRSTYKYHLFMHLHLGWHSSKCLNTVDFKYKLKIKYLPESSLQAGFFSALGTKIGWSLMFMHCVRQILSLQALSKSL